MNNIKLIFFDFIELYKIFNEFGNFFNYELKKVQNNEELDKETNLSDNYLVITHKLDLNCNNKIIFENMPLRISKIIEKINVNLLKNNFLKKSNIMVGKYKINLNSKEIFFDNISLKLTEKEIKMIIYISESLKPVTIDELQKKIWEYGQDLETHTVETHIHRLRKKILDNYNDRKFIISTKNGYQIIEKK
jgi:DNA-binding winged helix-turn-helix (wHTH) protein